MRYTTTAPGRVSFGDGVWLLVKLAALVLMLFDHADQALWGGALGFHDSLGRAVFPLFALTLGRSAMLGEPLHLVRVVVPRIVLFGLLAMPAYVALFGWWPLNVMFSLALGLGIVAVWRLGYRALPLAAFVLGGAFVDYQWFGLACIALSALALSRPRLPVAVLLSLMAVLLVPINGSLWALAAVPLFAVAAALDPVEGPRMKWLFYGLYPGHLYLLAFAVWGIPAIGGP